MKLLVTTGFGNIIQGGADLWTNHFINLVLPELSDDYFIFVDGRKPVGFETSLTNYHFHYDVPLNKYKGIRSVNSICFIKYIFEFSI